MKPEVITKPKEEKAEFLQERDAKNYGEQKIIRFYFVCIQMMIYRMNRMIKYFSAPPKHDQLKKKEAETKQKEVIHVMTPKIMNSLKAELTKMAQAAENKKCQGELAGMSVT